jgi:hypothetical protein
VAAADVGWLRDLLRGADGPVPVGEVRAAATQAALSWRSVERAKAALKVKPRRRGFGASAYWTWQLPAAEETGTCPCCGLPQGLRPMEVAGFGGTVYVRT